MTEYELIRKIAGKFSRSGLQRNGLFESDAEIIEIGGAPWGLTIDEFSPGEDLFTSDDPCALGANLATATISDLLAAGVKPEFFMHAISLPDMDDTKFFDGMTDGIRQVLEKSGCFLCGGDIGRSDTWRYCGFAMGPVLSKSPIMRIIPARKQALWITGTLGDANLAAFCRTASPRFELRLNEASFIRENASAGIDTSGGLLDALDILRRLNPSIRFEISLDSLPYSKRLVDFSMAKGIPAVAGLVGGAGEYELLFTSDTELPPKAAKEIAALPITRIGTALADAGCNSGLFLSGKGQPPYKLEDVLPSPRNYASMDEYMKDVISLSHKITNQEGA